MKKNGQHLEAISIQSFSLKINEFYNLYFNTGL